jgi:hypothetical protein
MARGTAFARYLRKVHVEWCPFKPKALGPVFLQEISSRAIVEAVPKMAISKQLARTPARIAAETEAPPAYVDRVHLTFADGSERQLELSGLLLGDVIDEINMENVRILRAERERGRPF